MASITNEKTSIRGIIGRKHKAKLSFVRQEAVSSDEIIARSRGVVGGGERQGRAGPPIFFLEFERVFRPVQFIFLSINLVSKPSFGAL